MGLGQDRELKINGTAGTTQSPTHKQTNKNKKKLERKGGYRWCGVTKYNSCGTAGTKQTNKQNNKQNKQKQQKGGGAGRGQRGVEDRTHVGLLGQKINQTNQIK